MHDACAAAFDVFYRAIHFCAETFARIPGLSFPDSAVPWLAAATGLAVLFAATALPLKRRPA